jgi:hypothetical protein
MEPKKRFMPTMLGIVSGHLQQKYTSTANMQTSPTQVDFYEPSAKGMNGHSCIIGFVGLGSVLFSLLGIGFFWFTNVVLVSST